MDDKIIFQNNINMLCIQSLYCIGGYVTYEVLISTGSFSGKCNFCIEENIIEDYVRKIDKMIKSLSGEMKIYDCESDAYLKFIFEDRMNFNVVGQIGGSHEENVLIFKLKADQSLLFGLKEKLLDY